MTLRTRTPSLPDTAGIFDLCKPQDATEIERMMEYAHQLFANAVLDRNQPRLFELLQAGAPVVAGPGRLHSTDWGILHHFVQSSDRSEQDGKLLGQLLAYPAVRASINHAVDGKTALHEAMAQKNDVCACVLIDHGARLSEWIPMPVSDASEHAQSADWRMLSGRAWELPRTIGQACRRLTLTHQHGIGILAQFHETHRNKGLSQIRCVALMGMIDAILDTMQSYGPLHPKDETKLFSTGCAYLKWLFIKPLTGQTNPWKSEIANDLFGLFERTGVDMLGARMDRETATARRMALLQATGNDPTIIARIDGLALDRTTPTLASASSRRL